MRASCHIGGWPGADVHSDMRVNGFLYAQSVVMWIQHQNRRVAWLGAGDSHPFGSRTKCSCPAEAHSASKCENMLWNRGFMYKWRGKLLLLLGAKRAISPSAADSQQGLLFIYCQVGHLQHHPVVPYLRPLAPAVRLPVSPR